MSDHSTPAQCLGCVNLTRNPGACCNALEGQSSPGRSGIVITIELMLAVLAADGKCPVHKMAV